MRIFIFLCKVDVTCNQTRPKKIPKKLTIEVFLLDPAPTPWPPTGGGGLASRDPSKSDGDVKPRSPTIHRHRGRRYLEAGTGISRREAPPAPEPRAAGLRRRRPDPRLAAPAAGRVPGQADKPPLFCAVLKPWRIKSSATQRGPGEGWRLRKESENGCSRIQSSGIAVRMLQM